jgi:hypothetical protein
MSFGLRLPPILLAPAAGPGGWARGARETGRVNRVTAEARGFHPTGPP